MLKNPFRSKTKEEIAKEEKDKREIEVRLKNVAESARHILSSQDAIKYKNDLEIATKEINLLMIRNVEPDPVKFSFFCKTCLTKLSVYYEILERIEQDAK